MRTSDSDDSRLIPCLSSYADTLLQMPSLARDHIVASQQLHIICCLFVVFCIVRVFHLETTLEVSEKEVQHGAMGLDSNPKNQRSANGDAIFQTGRVLGIAGLCLPTWFVSIFMFAPLRTVLLLLKSIRVCCRLVSCAAKSLLKFASLSSRISCRQM